MQLLRRSISFSQVANSPFSFEVFVAAPFSTLLTGVLVREDACKSCVARRDADVTLSPLELRERNDDVSTLLRDRMRLPLRVRLASGLAALSELVFTLDDALEVAGVSSAAALASSLCDVTVSFCRCVSVSVSYSSSNTASCCVCFSKLVWYAIGFSRALHSSENIIKFPVRVHVFVTQIWLHGRTCTCISNWIKYIPAYSSCT